MAATKEFALNYISELKEILDSISVDHFEDILGVMLQAYNNGNSIFIMGNGGSGATASHFACDINKGVCLGLSRKMKVICLNDNMPILLAYANDTSYREVFVEQLKNFMRIGDIVIGISGSGNSNNVIEAIKYANEKGAESVGLTGFDGGELAKVAKTSIVVPTNDMQKVEDIHMILVHMFMQVLYKTLHEKPASTTLYKITRKKTLICGSDRQLQKLSSVG